MATGPGEQLPLALVYGEALTRLPQDLYIPPDALEIILDAFEGPLDLLLYLIRKQNIDILDIPVADITRQYMQYVELMRATRLELAAEYLVMSAMLTEIKSRMLLPRHQAGDDDEEDPRAELVRRLQEYERFKEAAEKMDRLPRVGRDIFLPLIRVSHVHSNAPHPDVGMDELLQALADVLKRADMYESHQVSRETLSTRERMGMVLEKLHGNSDFVPFREFFSMEEGRLGVVVTFMAILELVKESLVELVQNRPYAEIHVRMNQS